MEILKRIVLCVNIIFNRQVYIYHVVSLIVTHVVTPVDKGCCPRTLKYLYAVAAAKWIVSYNCELCHVLCTNTLSLLGKLLVNAVLTTAFIL